MIYITGDIHGGLERIWNIQHKYKLTKDDYIIVCGDFGIIWQKTEVRRQLTKLRRCSEATILFVDGNHENFDLLEEYPVIEKFGGKVGYINDQVYHLRRGEVYDIDGHVFFCFGGAHSIDQAYRIPRKSWWPEEIPTDDEIMHGSENLAANLDRIEYVITHEAPAIVRRQIYTHHSAEFGEPLTYKLPSIFDNWLETVMFDAPNFKRWYCGHHHQNENFDRRGIPCTMLYRLEEEIE